MSAPGSSVAASEQSAFDVAKSIEEICEQMMKIKGREKSLTLSRGSEGRTTLIVTKHDMGHTGVGSCKIFSINLVSIDRASATPLTTNHYQLKRTIIEAKDGTSEKCERISLLDVGVDVGGKKLIHTTKIFFPSSADCEFVDDRAKTEALAFLDAIKDFKEILSAQASLPAPRVSKKAPAGAGSAEGVGSAEGAGSAAGAGSATPLVRGSKRGLGADKGR